MSAKLIGIDWGSSNFRAYLIGSDATIIDKKYAPCGMLKLKRHEYAPTLNKQIKDWLQQHPGIDIVMTGMVGSRQGWEETDYLACPVDLKDLSKSLISVKFTKQNRVFIIPGLALNDKDNPDVMRGEETQLLGAGTDNVMEIFCLPGTHSKWVIMQECKIENFTTCMTGELFSLLRKHSILAKQMLGQKPNNDIFLEGVQHSQKSHGLLIDIFKLRVKALSDQLRTEHTSAYLSGLLVGHEIASAKQLLNINNNSRINIVSDSRLTDSYLLALKQFDLNGIAFDQVQAVVRGLYLVHSNLPQ